MFRLPSLIVLALTSAAQTSYASLVVSADETSPGQYTIDVSTDITFDTIQIEVYGDVGNGVNIVPDSMTLFGKAYVDNVTSTALTPLGSPSTDGVFDPGLNGDIDLTYGVTFPAGGGEWTTGLTDAPFLQFDLLSGMADVTVNLLRGGPVAATSTIQTVSTIPEAESLLQWSMLTFCALVGTVWRMRLDKPNPGRPA